VATKTGEVKSKRKFFGQREEANLRPNANTLPQPKHFHLVIKMEKQEKGSLMAFWIGWEKVVE